jgi:rhamnosyltransferase
LSVTQLSQGKSNKVAVLLATYNGLTWLNAQLESLLNQLDVDVTIFVSDDCSSDQTFQYFNQLALKEPRIVLLPSKGRIRSAGKNFYRLIIDVDISDFDYIAFSDQDDIWDLDKLSRHIQLIKLHNAEAISSNVLAFWPNGHQKLIVKSQPQKKYDFLFESAGPGCTFLLTPWLVNELKYQLINNEVSQQVAMHDWLAYAICRAHGKVWVIDSAPSIQYRQHQNNLIGANIGLKASVSRLKKINSGWYRDEVALISRVVASISPDPNLQKFKKIIQLKSSFDRFKLFSFALQGRRKLTDRCILVFSILFSIF